MSMYDDLPPGWVYAGTFFPEVEPQKPPEPEPKIKTYRCYIDIDVDISVFSEPDPEDDYREAAAAEFWDLVFADPDEAGARMVIEEVEIERSPTCQCSCDCAIYVGRSEGLCVLCRTGSHWYNAGIAS